MGASKLEVARDIASFSSVREHIRILYRNLDQLANFNEPVSEPVERAMGTVIQVIVGQFVDCTGGAISPEHTDVRQAIVERADDLCEEIQKTEPIEQIKSPLRVAFSKMIGLGKPLGPAVLIRYVNDRPGSAEPPGCRLAFFAFSSKNTGRKPVLFV